MSMFAIETILMNHGLGFGAGGSGTVDIVGGSNRPTDGLKNGLIWLNEDNGTFHIYLNGQWWPLGGGLGIMATYQKVELSEPTAVVAIPFADFVPATDILFVTQNTTAISATEHYTIDRINKTIVKTDGVWPEDTHLMFTRLIQTSSSNKEMNITVYENRALAEAGVATVPIDIPYYNPATDHLRVFMRNTPLFKDVNYTVHPEGSSITLLFTTEQQEEFYFEVQKKLRSAELSDADLLTEQDGKIKNLSQTIAQHKEVTASTTTVGHTRLSNAIDSTSDALAATPFAVSRAYIRANDAINSANEIQTELNVFKRALTEGFVANQFSDGLTTLDAFHVTAGYYNQSLTRLEV